MSSFNMSSDNSSWVPSTAEECLAFAVKNASSGGLLEGLWYVGVILSTVASIVSNMGVNLQKYSMNLEYELCQKDPEYRERPYIMQPWWLFGLANVIGGAVGDFVALGFCAASLATPVGGFTMVCNCVFAHFFLHEVMTKRDYIATLLVLIGVVAVAVSADKTNATYDLPCILKLYGRMIFIIYTVVLTALVAWMWSLARWLNKEREAGSTSAAYLRWKIMHPVVLSGLSGIVGAQSVLFAKCSAELFKVTFDGDNQFNKWETYVIVLSMTFTIINQLQWLANALKYFDAVIVIPLFQAFFIAFGVVGAGVLFAEFDNLQLWEKLTFAAGCAITIAGVCLLAQRGNGPPPADEQTAKVLPEGAAGEAALPPNAVGADGAEGGAGGSGHDNAAGPAGPQAVAARPASAQRPYSAGRPYSAAGRPITPGGRLLSGAEGSGDRPVTPMPLSMQYQSLAVVDVYTALRASLATPDGGRRRPPSQQGAGFRPNSQQGATPPPGAHPAAVAPLVTTGSGRGLPGLHEEDKLKPDAEPHARNTTPPKQGGHSGAETGIQSGQLLAKHAW
jgi:hypothetical protein